MNKKDGKFITKRGNVQPIVENDKMNLALNSDVCLERRYKGMSLQPFRAR